MRRERCDECGFDSETWTEDAALDAIGGLPTQWRRAVADLEHDALNRRAIPDTWSIAEYVDHVREVLFGMRFVLDSAVADPGVRLGPAPEPAFTPVAREIDVARALGGLEREALQLRDRLTSLAGDDWTASAVVGEDAVDARWICRHAVHDAMHHLDDVRKLRDALG